MSDLYGKSSVIRWIRVLFGLLEMQEGGGCGEMTGRVEVCFLWVVIFIGYECALFDFVGSRELCWI
jgi:hypothetical protein